MEFYCIQQGKDGWNEKDPSGSSQESIIGAPILNWGLFLLLSLEHKMEHMTSCETNQFNQIQSKESLYPHRPVAGAHLCVKKKKKCRSLKGYGG